MYKIFLNLKLMNVVYLLVIVTMILLSCSRSRNILMVEEPDKELTPGTTAEQTNILDGIFDRKTARQFSQIEVTQEQISLLLKAAFSSPTGGNQRSWEFIVVTDRNTMINMKRGNPYSQALDTAPLVIVIAVNTQTAAFPELLTIDAGIAAQSILVQASKLGLTSVPMSIAPQKIRIEGVSQALNIPAGIIPQIMICLGQPSVDTVSSASTSFYSESKIHYDKYQ